METTIQNKFCLGVPDLMLKKLSESNEEYFYRQSDTMTYFCYGNELLRYSSTGQYSEGLDLFKSVKKCFDDWLTLNPNPIFTERHAPDLTNPKNKYHKGKKYAYDINHAFWRIAFISGYINKKTYDRGLALKEKDSSLKQLYCMALSVRGNSKTLEGYIGMKSTGNKMILEGDKRHRDIYTDVRYKTFEIMDKIAYKLGDDFIEYKTDCVTFKNKKNCETVEIMLTEENVMFKKVI